MGWSKKEGVKDVTEVTWFVRLGEHREYGVPDRSETWRSVYNINDHTIGRGT